MAFVSPLSLTAARSHFVSSPQVCSLSSRGQAVRKLHDAFPSPSPSHRTTQPGTPITSPPTMNINTLAVYKDALLEKILPLNFGRAIADIPREQKEVEELTRQVESTNKSANPSTDPNLSGKWDMAYTTSTSILRVGLPKFLQPVKIIQYIDAGRLYAKNEEVFKVGPFEFRNAVEAKLTPKSKSYFEVKFTQFILFDTFKFNVEKNPKFKGALDITYLDDDLRVSRGDRGNLFVLTKDTEANYP